MKGLTYALRAEAFRLRKSRATWWSLLFLLALAAARVFVAHVAATLDGPPSGERSGTGWGPLVDGWRTALSAASLLLLMHAARTIAADRESGVLRTSLTRASSRAATAFARALLAVPIVLVSFAAAGLGAFLAARAFFDFGPLVEDGYVLLTAEELRAELWSCALATLPALVAVYAFGLALSGCVRSPVLALSASLSLFLAFDLFKEAIGEAQFWVFASFAPSFVDGSALSEMSGVARGFSDAGYPDRLLELSFVMPTIQALLFVGLACLGVSRRAA